MKKLLTLVSLSQLLIVSSFGQNFTFHSVSPFGIQPIKEDSTRAAQKVMFADYDGDGDLDLFLTGIDVLENFDSWEGIHYFIEMQENIGDKWHPQFGERIEVFQSFPFPLGYFFPSAGDLNNDGKLDFIVSSIVDFIGNRTSTYLECTAGGTGKEFEVTRFDSLGLIDFVPESFFIPELVDLDADGDLDILMSGFDPAFAEEDGADVPVYYYAKNFGTKAQADFVGWYSNPYGLMPNPLAEILTGGDIDNDGDVDLLGAPLVIPADSMNYLFVHLNTPGLNGKPLFDVTLESPYGLPESFGEAQFLFPNLVDIDGDGDLDVFVFLGEADGQVLQYYENSLCTGVINNLSVTLCEGESIVVGGVPYSNAGNYTIGLEGVNGCDSTIQLSITVDPIQTTILNESICEGEVVLVGDEVFDASGDYMVFLVAANGCDSMVFLSLVVYETYQTNFDESICDGESVHVGDEEFTVTGEYEVMLFSQAGCDSIIFLSLTVNENYITNLDESICNGDVYSIGMEDFTQTGHYEVLLFSQAGCDSLIALDLVVIEVDNSVNVNENILTAVQSGGSYQWVNCDSGENIPGATSQSYEVLETGNYAVNITDEFGCSAVSECVHVVITGIAEVALSRAITIYPNPTEGWVNVINTSPFSISRLKVTNLSGQVMGEFLLNGKNSVDVSFLEQGVYFVEMNVTGVMVINKLIIL